MTPSTMLDYWGFKMWAWDNWMIAKAPLRCWTTGEVLQGLTLQLMAESKIPMLKYQSLHGPLYNAGLQGKLDKEEGGVCPSKVSNWTARDWVATEMAWLTRESPRVSTKTTPGPRGRRVGCTAKDARGRKGSAWQALNLAPGLSPMIICIYYLLILST